jgi:hypothetical protein
MQSDKSIIHRYSNTIMDNKTSSSVPRINKLIIIQNNILRKQNQGKRLINTWLIIDERWFKNEAGWSQNINDVYLVS